jgi:hypothetical protein
MRIEADVSSRIACRIARAALHSSHRLLDFFEGLGKNSHLYSLNKCGITKCAEDPQRDCFLPSGLSLDDGVRSIGHTAVFCVRNQRVDALGNFGQCVISREILPQSLRLFPILRIR